MIKIVFEGIDGCGNGTQSQRVYDYFKKNNKNVKLYHEPRIIRDQIFKACDQVGTNNIDDSFVSALFLVDGTLCRREEIAENYDIILRDRDTSVSMYAYHHGLGTDDKFIYSLSTFINSIHPVDLLIYLDLPVDIAIDRIIKRSSEKKIDDYFEKGEKLRKTYDNYIQFMTNDKIRNQCGHTNTKIGFVNANNDPSAVMDNILEIIKAYLKIEG